MRSLIKNLPLFIVLLLLGVLSVFPQIEQCPYIDNAMRSEPLSDHVKERMIELCIEENKKDFEKLLNRSEEIAKLTQEISESYHENRTLSVKDMEKLDKVEEILSKIRKELRADTDDEDEDKRVPEDVVDAIKLLHENTSKLLDEIKKTTRHTISAIAIQSSNTVLKLVKFLRFSN